MGTGEMGTGIEMNAPTAMSAVKSPAV